MHIADRICQSCMIITVTPDHRSLGQIAWHLVMVLGSMTQIGLDFSGPDGGERAPASARTIAEEYRRLAQALLHAVQTQWTDASLREAKSLFGQDSTNGAALRLLAQHEGHHRGQMTVLIRQAGLHPPGVYGPTKEEWIAMGRKP